MSTTSSRTRPTVWRATAVDAPSLASNSSTPMHTYTCSFDAMLEHEASEFWLHDWLTPNCPKCTEPNLVEPSLVARGYKVLQRQSQSVQPWCGTSKHLEHWDRMICKHATPLASHQTHACKHKSHSRIQTAAWSA